MEERATIIEEGRIIAGKIRLERPLARGGMGAVWVAHHIQLDSPVAVKFMDPALAASPSARARFEREAKAAAQLQSPWVVRVQDYGVEGDTPYIIMELLVGEDLGQRLQKKGRLSAASLAPIVDQVCKALRRAHDVGLVHRDLKPGNIFLARQDAHDERDEAVKLLDFGIAKLIVPGSPQSGDVTRSGHLVGSPLYMSPEQIRKSKEVDHRSDLWSLGVILYQALTGHTPFVEDEIGAVLVAICTDPILPPSEVAPDLGTAFDAFFTRALARRPAERFQSARELNDAFAALAGTRPAAPEIDKKSDGIVVVQRSPEGSASEAHSPSGAGGSAPGGESTLELAKTVPALGAAPGSPDGTLSPSGVTQEEGRASARRSRSLFAAAALLIAALAFAAWWTRAPSAEPTAKDDRPGSPSLPLPPPTSSASAAVEAAIDGPSDVAPPAASSAAAKLDPAKVGAPDLRAAPTQAPLVPARGDAPAASGKRVVGAKSRPAGAASADPSSDEKELGL